MAAVFQMPLPRPEAKPIDMSKPYRERLVALLSEDLGFHQQGSGYASHNLHSFPAKFPPQLPRKFIQGLTNVGDIVLDPMAGSGTTIVEAFLADRQAIGFDIDPLALLVSRVKVTPLDENRVRRHGYAIIKKATQAVEKQRDKLEQALEDLWDTKTREFVNYWFAKETQVELVALLHEIERIEDEALKAFFELAFSAIIITKSGGVSLAFDLAHTRPHRAKVVFSQTGKVVLGRDLVGSTSSRVKLLTKTLRSPLEEFQRRLKKNLEGLYAMKPGRFRACTDFGDAQALPLNDSSVDLIVTSPPYAANAIDYMRAHKFSLVWMGYPVDDLSQKRKEYIGGEGVTDVEYEELPDTAAQVITEISGLDDKKGLVLHRYYSEMTRTLREMLRVLRPGKAAIVVVGSSIMRGRDTKTYACLADIGRTIGFEVPKIGVRGLDRNRRMLPAGFKPNMESQIQQRMHEEYVIGLYKPESQESPGG